MKREEQMKFKVSKEEKQTIENNAKEAGFSSAAAYMRNKCLNDRGSSLYLRDKCEIRDSLQMINKLVHHDSKVVCYTNRINNVIDTAGEL